MPQSTESIRASGGVIRRLRGHALVPIFVALGLLIGLFRELILAYIFGTDPQVESFRVAYALPSIVSEAVAVSVISGLIPPMLRSPGAGGIRVGFWSTAIVGGALTTLGILTMPLQARYLAPGFSPHETALVVSSGRICWIMPMLLLCSYSFRAAISIEGRTWLTSMGTFLRNVLFVSIFLLSSVSIGASSTSASVAAALAGLLILLFYARAYSSTAGEPISLRTLIRCPMPWRVSRPLTITLSTILCSQVLLSGGRIIDRIASSLLEQGALASVEYSYAVIMALSAAIGTSANLVLAPAIGRAVHRTGAIPRVFWRILIIVVVSMTAVGCITAMIARPIVSLIYGRGAFNASGVHMTATVFQFQVASLGFVIGSLLAVQMLILVNGQRSLIWIAALKLILKATSLMVAMQFMATLPAIGISLGIAEAGTLLVVVIVTARRKVETANA